MSTMFQRAAAAVCLAATALPFVHISLLRRWQADKDVQPEPVAVPAQGLQHCLAYSLPFLALLGLALSGVLAAFAASNVASWLAVAAWVLACLQILMLMRAKLQSHRYTLGLWVSFSALLLSVSQAATWLPHSTRDVEPTPDLVLASLAVATGLCLVGIPLWCIPRRNPPYSDGVPMDRQNACSMLDRLSFSWVKPLLDSARTRATLEYSDLPSLDRKHRSATLLARGSPYFRQGRSDKKFLWRSIVQEHYITFLRQWLLGIAKSIFMIIPPLCLYQILVLLETRSHGNPAMDLQLSQWIVALGLSKLAHVSLGVWTDFAAYSLCSVRVRNYLSGIVFQKALRGKIVAESQPSATESGPKTAPKQQPVDDSQPDAAVHDEATPLLTDQTDDEANNTSDAPSEKTPSRGLITLIAVDVRRIEAFCRYSVEIWQGIVEVILAMVFLVKLLGWWSTLGGLAVPLLLYPVNRLCFVKYMEIQEVLMKIRDRKQHAISEAFNGIRQIKFSATEPRWDQSIMAIRKQEYDASWSANYWIIPLFMVWRAVPILMGGVALTVYTLLSNQMAPSVIFAALSIFSSLEAGLAAFPLALGCLFDSLVSAKRIEEHLRSEDKADILTSGDSIEFRNASLAWPSNKESLKTPVLRNVSLCFPTRGLSIIAGKTGSGKSLLLAAIIGEAEVLAGSVDIPQPPLAENNDLTPQAPDVLKHSQMAFVSQVPWLENATLKDNILFGSAYSYDRYVQVLHASALQPDLETLQDGDRTELGVSGVNLSGGQKWRVALARALYSQAGILVLDDIFSAVDAHVGRHLLVHALLGDLAKDRTIILATHHTGLVEQHARYIVRLRNGEVEGNVPTLLTAQAFSAASAKVLGAADQAEKMLPEAKKFVQDEHRQQGRVALRVYTSYLATSGGWLHWCGIFLLFVLYAATTLLRTYWVAIWTSQYESSEQYVPNHDENYLTSEPDWRMYLGVYAMLSFSSVALLCIQLWVVSIAALGAASRMFRSASHNVLRAPMRWLDTQPLGRVLNRFVADFTVLDSRVGVDIAWTVGGAFSTLVVVVSALFVSPWMLIPVVAITTTCIYVTWLYLDAARDLRRLESTARSPVHDLVSSTISGLATIRCFGRVGDYMDKMHGHIDRYARTSWYFQLATCWVRFRQGLLGTILVLCVAVAVVKLDGISASLAGFAMSFALQFSDVVETTIRQYAEMEMDMNYAERVLEYGDLETEPSEGNDIPASWPWDGKVEFKHVEVGYAEDLPSVLKQISFVAQPRQRVGIVGRTGSGKSSLTLALFRFLNLRHGVIEIDGIDISTIKLPDIRSRMTIIPQDPVLFSGTLRSNLDPFDDYEDAILLQALRRVHLLDSPFDSDSNTTSTHTTIFANLSFPVSTSGSNLSQGQKQLLCLARALITRPKILILDEATSAVDTATDTIIQTAIREEFPETTLLVIAHRLSTIRDFDKVLVLDEGRVVEFGEPDDLMKKEAGAFREMLGRTG